MTGSKVTTGLERLTRARFATFLGQRVGLLVNQSSVDCQFQHIADLVKSAAGLELVRIFGPEHGFSGTAQDLEHVSERDRPHPRWGVPVISLYGETEASLTPERELLEDLDALIVDLPDVGSRYYTFAATLIRTLRASSGLKTRIVVLDRPNPLGGVISEGPLVQPGFESFVGEIPIPIRHGMTIAEIARWVVDQERLNVELETFHCEGWQPDQLFPETGLPWVIPSPNMPTFKTALVYPGGCLIEGTNLSEGRGTTRPFEIFGAPWIDEFQLADSLNQSGLSGFIARPTQFKPTFQKHAGQVCHGVQIHVTDHVKFRPVRLYTAAIISMRNQNPQKFQWRMEEYEYRTFPIAIDLLYGSSNERTMIEANASWQDIAECWNDLNGK